MLGTTLGTKNISVKKKKRNLWFCGAYMIVETNNKKIIKKEICSYVRRMSASRNTGK